MSGTEETLDIEGFRTRARQAGLALDESEVQVMYEGYLGLQTLLARLPRRVSFTDEPATVFLGPGTRIGR